MPRAPNVIEGLLRRGSVGRAGLYPDRVGGLTLQHDIHDVAEGETHGTGDGETASAGVIGLLDLFLEILGQLALDRLAADSALGGGGVPLARMALGTPLGGVVGGSPLMAALEAAVVVVLLEPQDGPALGAVLGKCPSLPDRPFVSAPGARKNGPWRYFWGHDHGRVHNEKYVGYII